MCVDQQFPLNVEDVCANSESSLFPLGIQMATHCFSFFPVKFQCLVLVAKGPRKEAKPRGCSVLHHTPSHDGFCLLGRAVVPKGEAAAAGEGQLPFLGQGRLQRGGVCPGQWEGFGGRMA